MTNATIVPVIVYGTFRLDERLVRVKGALGSSALWLAYWSGAEETGAVGVIRGVGDDPTFSLNPLLAGSVANPEDLLRYGLAVYRRHRHG